MNVKLMQCPSCGASISSSEVGTYTFCNYCGVRLEVLQGASGAHMAKIAEIKTDTSFMAKERAKEHLRSRIDDLEEQIGVLQTRGNLEIEKAVRDVRYTALAAAILAFIVTWWVGDVLMSRTLGLPLGLLLAVFVFLGVRAWRLEAKITTISAGYCAKTGELQKAQAKLYKDVRRIEKELDQLARTV